MATKRPAQGRQENKKIVRQAAGGDNVRTSGTASGLASNNKPKRVT